MPKNPLIVIEAAKTENYALLDYLKKCKNYSVLNVEYDLSRLDYIIPKIDLEEHDHLSMCFGSINFIKRINRTTPYQFMADFDVYKPSVYADILKQDFLNYDGVFLPYSYLKQQDKIEKLKNILGTDEIFVKSDDSDKKLTGQVIYKNFGIVFTNTTITNDSFLCLCAKKQKISREWRLVVSAKSQQNVYASTLYLEKDKICHGPCPLIVKHYANRVLSNFTDHYTEPLFVMDICELEDGTLKVLELNAFSTSGFYGCDPLEIDDALTDWFKHCRNER